MADDQDEIEKIMSEIQELHHDIVSGGAAAGSAAKPAEGSDMPSESPSASEEENLFDSDDPIFEEVAAEAGEPAVAAPAAAEPVAAITDDILKEIGATTELEPAAAAPAPEPVTPAASVAPGSQASAAGISSDDAALVAEMLFAGKSDEEIAKVGNASASAPAPQAAPSTPVEAVATAAAPRVAEEVSPFPVDIASLTQELVQEVAAVAPEVVAAPSLSEVPAETAPAPAAAAPAPAAVALSESDVAELAKEFLKDVGPTPSPQAFGDQELKKIDTLIEAAPATDRKSVV